MQCRIIYSWVFIWCLGIGINVKAQDNKKPDPMWNDVETGAQQTGQYIPMLEGKNVGLLINQTSVINGVLLADTLLSRNVKVKKIFAPEHGFRGYAQAGEEVGNEKDKKTGLPVISLYGKSKKPSKQDLKNIDVLIYDIQDVGARFYTYISTLQYAMEACAEYGVELLILDRPNPNGHYVDGPVLDTAFRSFVGMQPIPVVYGMTPGEYAKMLVGEGWFRGAKELKMQVIPCKYYDHHSLYRLPVAPSPNLPSMTAIYSYPTVCLFEGTVVSVGRGTDKPFQQWGHPAFSAKSGFSFKPVPVWGSKIDPPFAFQTCHGQLVAINESEALTLMDRQIRLFWLIRAYSWFPDKDKFFVPFFEKLAGTDKLRQQIISGMDEAAIKATWQEDLKAFKKIRKKYLLYKDFED
jgi:uncharacterized protein YbbC (DUF1343 family)